MEVSDIGLLRKAAPNWNLAGDKNLLSILEKMHQNLMSKCQEVNTKLDEMVTTLDNANIDLQNVNNKFMALSNTQFVESRVYDDDTEAVESPNNKKPPPESVQQDELTKLKHSLQTLEQMHEAVRILDSDSSDEEDDGRLVLKPKEWYSDRPLPYIIGSEEWRTKWHVGLVAEDSDSDSSGEGRREEGPSDQYSDSDDGDDERLQERVEQATVSSGSDIFSEASPRAPADVAPDVAAEVARRLGGQAALIPEPEVNIPEPIKRKVYKPEQPISTTIFSDEPPPLDDLEESSDDDIFAELHKKPYPRNKGQSRSNFVKHDIDDLFGESENELYVDYNKDQNDEYRKDEKINTSVKEQSPLSDGPLATHSDVREQNTSKQTSQAETSKKPIGGISLFGSNKGAESIGAAILKRSQRKSSSDEENDITNKVKSNKALNKTDKDNKDVIKDLFVKPKSSEKQTEKPKAKIDLFSDDIFDDIDDIFTTDILTKPKQSTGKSLFDDDELFADVAVPKADTKKSGTTIFESDDDLFAEDNVKTATKNDHIKIEISNTSTGSRVADHKTIKPKSIFSDESDDDMFSNEKDGRTISVVPKSIYETKNDTIVNKISNDDKIINDERNKTSSSIQNVSNEKITNIKESIFGDNDDIFSQSLRDEPPPPIYEKYNERKVTNIIKDVDSVNVIQNTLKTDNYADKESRLIETKASLAQLDKCENDKTVDKNTVIKTTSIFDDDSGDDDIFSGIKPKDNITEDNLVLKTQENENTNVINIEQPVINMNSNSNILKKHGIETTNMSYPTKVIITTSDQIFQSPSLFDDDEIKNLEHDADWNSNVTTITENIGSEQENSMTVPSSINVVISDDILKNDYNVINKTENNDYKEETIKIKNNVQSDFKKEEPPVEDDNAKHDTSTDSKESISKEPIISKRDIFDDIFSDLPPDFAKTTETKKSKNINALFDDDSDDEASFFKKNEIVTDEVPNFGYNDDRFSIFHDEPPDVDVDFIQKSKRGDESEDDLFGTKNSTQKSKSIRTDIVDIHKPNLQDTTLQTGDIETQIDKTISDQEIFKKNIYKSQLLEGENKIESESFNSDYIEKENTVLSKQDYFTNIDKNKIDTAELDGKKKVGKLKPNSLNIDVNSLLPGAVKAKTCEETDGQTFSSKSNEELNIHTPDKTESKIVKSVSFEGNAESRVLDNKLSKERAKIKVKRRPSSRRARLEAVRKSGIEFGEDSTDNSSSIDEPPKNSTNTTPELQNMIDETDNLPTSTALCDRTENPSTKIHTAFDSKPESSKNVDTTTVKPLKNELMRKSDEQRLEVKSKVIDNILNKDEMKTLEDNASNFIRNTKNPEVKSKIVYILHDEDIFSSDTIKIEKKVSKKDLEIKEDSDEELFKNAKPSIKPTDKTVATAVKKSEKDNLDNKNAKKSIFDDLSDDEDLFLQKAETSMKKNLRKDLFKKKESNIIGEQKQTAKTKSLFGDESDDELFNAPSTKSIDVKKVKPKEMTNTSTEAVSEDPLSLFNDSDS